MKLEEKTNATGEAISKAGSAVKKTTATAVKTETASPQKVAPNANANANAGANVNDKAKAAKAPVKIKPDVGAKEAKAEAVNVQKSLDRDMVRRLFETGEYPYKRKITRKDTSAKRRLFRWNC